MIESLRNWWDGHGVAERALIAVLGVAIAVVILWLGIWRPVEDGLASGWARQGAAVERYGSVRSKVEAMKRLSTPSASGVPLEQLVGQTAAEAGFTLDKVATQGAGRMSVSIASARTGPLLSWLQRLEQAGIAVQTINIVPGSADGTVAVQAVFQESAR